MKGDYFPLERLKKKIHPMKLALVNTYVTSLKYVRVIAVISLRKYAKVCFKSQFANCFKYFFKFQNSCC